MSLKPLPQLLQQFRRTWGAGKIPFSGFDPDEEAAIIERFDALLGTHPDCYDRIPRPGHITGSALITDTSLTKVLLTLHGKLGIWIQLGGHADGETEPHVTALREGFEESGLSRLMLLPYEKALTGGTFTLRDAPAVPPLPFDFDIHPIPERKDEPAHLHYDVRYLVVADLHEPLNMSHESKDLRWFDISEARLICKERSMLRQLDKLEALQRYYKQPVSQSEDIPWLTTMTS